MILPVWIISCSRSQLSCKSSIRPLSCVSPICSLNCDVSSIYVTFPQTLPYIPSSTSIRQSGTRNFHKWENQLPWVEGLWSPPISITEREISHHSTSVTLPPYWCRTPSALAASLLTFATCYSPTTALSPAIWYSQQTTQPSVDTIR